MKRMKIISLLLVLCCMWAVPSFAAMSTTEVRENARFMTDRMAHELGLSSMQRNDVYEINYDFFESVRYVMDDLAAGYSYAIDRYYENLDLRNDDLSYVLTRSQFERFMNRDYFYRPLYVDNHTCRIRIYSVYTNPTFYYFAAPLNFLTYVGLHSRAHYAHGFYCNRYHHPRYTGVWIRPSRHTHYAINRRHDFGPGIAGRPVSRPTSPSRPPVRPPHDNRPQRPNVRPSHDSRPQRPNVRPSHDNRPQRPNVRPSHDNRPQRPNVRPSHDNRPQRPNVRPSHDSRPQKPNAQPSHDNRPQRPGIRPSNNNRPSRPGVRPSNENRPSRPSARPSEKNDRPQRGERRTVKV